LSGGSSRPFCGAIIFSCLTFTTSFPSIESVFQTFVCWKGAVFFSSSSRIQRDIFPNSFSDMYTLTTGIIEPRAGTLELPLLVRSGTFFFDLSPGLKAEAASFRGVLTPYPREGISEVLARGSIILVLMIPKTLEKLAGLKTACVLGDS